MKILFFHCCQRMNFLTNLWKNNYWKKHGQSLSTLMDRTMLTTNFYQWIWKKTKPTAKKIIKNWMSAFFYCRTNFKFIQFIKQYKEIRNNGSNKWMSDWILYKVEIKWANFYSFIFLVIYNFVLYDVKIFCRRRVCVIFVALCAYDWSYGLDTACQLPDCAQCTQ